MKIIIIGILIIVGIRIWQIMGLTIFLLYSLICLINIFIIFSDFFLSNTRVSKSSYNRPYSQPRGNYTPPNYSYTPPTQSYTSPNTAYTGQNGYSPPHYSYEGTKTASEVAKKNKAKAFAQKELVRADTMDGMAFENWCANVLKKNGYKHVKVTKGSGDQGADIICYNVSGDKIAVQCKRYSKPLSNRPVQEVMAGKAYYACTKAIVMTNNHFTSSAKDLARKGDVLLFDRNIIFDMLVVMYYSF